MYVCAAKRKREIMHIVNTIFLLMTKKYKELSIVKQPIIEVTESIAYLKKLLKYLIKIHSTFLI